MRLLGCLFLAVVAVVLQAARAAPRTAASLRQDDGLVDLVEAEVLAWRAAGYASVIQFPDDARRPAKAFLAGNKGNSRNAIVPTDDDVKFHVFTRSNESDIEGTCVSLDEQSLLQAGWDPSLPTKVIVHGFTNTIASRAVQDIKNAYLGRGRYNVVGVDWGALCPAPLYVTARLNVGFAASRVAALLRLLLTARLAQRQDMHLLGHSLGAHVAGLAAQELHNTTGERPGRITGLDPAWPLFMLAGPTARLSAQQADTVDVIHTCAGFLGFPTAIGTTDFFPNGGSSQPGCVADALGICAHDRSFQYFVESIAQGAGFQADFCADDKAARHSECADKPDGCMGDEIYFRKEGSYYVNTTVEDAANECGRFNPPA